MKFKLMWWEDNGHHDSYFYGVYFDDADGQLHKAELGATAYGGGIGFSEEYAMPTPAVVEAARSLLADGIFTQIRAAEHRDVLEPSFVNPGDILRLTQDHKSRKAGRVLNVDTRVRVNECTAFGQFYSRGYNKPGRHNRSVVGTVVGQPSVLVRVPLAKCRLDREPMSDAKLRERADRLSYEHQYGPLFGMRAWECENWAARVAVQNQDTVQDTTPTSGQGAE